MKPPRTQESDSNRVRGGSRTGEVFPSVAGCHGTTRDGQEFHPPTSSPRWERIPVGQGPVRPHQPNCAGMPDSNRSAGQAAHKRCPVPSPR